MTVMISKFSGDGTKIDWSHGANNGADVDVSSLVYGKDMDNNDDKTVIIVEDTVDNTKSYYPMSGGPIAQELHKHYLEQKTLGDVQADATARGIDTSGKTQDELIVLIIQDECNKKGVSYLL